MLAKVGVIDGDGSHCIDSHATQTVYQTQLRLVTMLLEPAGSRWPKRGAVTIDSLLARTRAMQTNHHKSHPKVGLAGVVSAVRRAWRPLP
jgi:hypothetical protein